MKIIFWCDNHAYFSSEKRETFTPESFGLTDDEWMELSDEEKEEYVKDWAYQCFSYGWREN